MMAKTRLGPVIPDSERIALAEAMYRDVLASALSSRNADLVAVISSGCGLLELARAAGALAIDEEYPRGLNAAVQMGTVELASRGVESLCTVLSDIPMITGEDIDQVFATMSPGRGAVLVPSRDLSGTNVIARSPAGVFPTRFGRQSLIRHIEECRNLDVPWSVKHLARPALDLDLPSDLHEFVRVAPPTHTLSQLLRLGIAHH